MQSLWLGDDKHAAACGQHVCAPGSRTTSTAAACLQLGGLPTLPSHANHQMQVLKTTQSGYSGFLHDRFTTLPDVGDRIVATSVTATWR